MSKKDRLEIIPLGGLGEFGMNLMVYRYDGQCLVVDAGMMFPGEQHLGIDVVIPDLSFLDDGGALLAAVLTHGHEDHIGAVPYLLARHDIPIHAPPHARGLVLGRLAEHPGSKRRKVERLPPDGTPVRIGPFLLETIQVAHSIPQSKMLVLRTPVGTVLHTADFKLDPAPPDGAGTDQARLEQLGGEGVLALLSDSTNADRPGVTPSEGTVTRAMDEVIGSCPHRVVVTCFASNIQRIQQLSVLAGKHRRRLALLGASVRGQVEVAQRLGLIRFPRGLLLAPEQVMAHRRDGVLVVATGSQGEPLSALARVAVGKHRHLELADGDLVVHSAREIPGNEKSIGRMIDHLLRRGARVLTARDAPVHASGHASRDELARLLDLVRPRFLVPIHGEYRHLDAHARLGVESGLAPDSILLAESGDVIALDASRVEIVDRVPVGRVFIDAALDRIHRSVIRDRRRSAGEGVVVAVVALDRDGRAAEGFPEIVTRGFVPGAGEDEGLHEEAKRTVVRALAEASPEERRDEGMLRARIQGELRRFLRRRTQRQPLIIPVIVEL